MNNRLTILDLAGILAEQTGKDKKETELFLRELVDIISEGIFTDKIVKVKGLGTFKLILVEKRESIHVNTGERILIPEHYKFSYIPDKELREEVNKPFAFFETIEINEGVTFDDLEKTSGSPAEQEAPDTREDSIIETKIETSIEEPIQEEPQPAIEEPQKTVESFQENGNEEIVESKLPAKEEIVEEEEAPVITEIRPVIEAEEIKTEEPPAEEPVPVEAPIQEPGPEAEPQKTADITSETNLEIQPEESSYTVQTTGIPPITIQTEEPALTPGKRSWKIVLISLSMILIMAGITGYLFNNVLFDKSVPAPTQQIQTAEVVPATEPETITETGEAETLSVEAPVLIEEKTTAVAKPAQDVIASIKIEAGSRLTLIALEQYGHKLFWVYIYDYNKNTIKDPNNIPIGTIINIPAKELYDINSRSQNSLQKAATLQTKILTGE